MAMMIDHTCICCDACEPECPNGAITAGEACYFIDPRLCTECVGHFTVCQCQEMCPAQCIHPHPDFRETYQQLYKKYLDSLG
jgi:ferredoxin